MHLKAPFHVTHLQHSQPVQPYRFILSLIRLSANASTIFLSSSTAGSIGSRRVGWSGDRARSILFYTAPRPAPLLVPSIKSFQFLRIHLLPV